MNLTVYSAMIAADGFEDGPGKGRMLGRLLKYELRATARLYFPLYLAVLILAALGRVSFFDTTWTWYVSGGYVPSKNSFRWADGPLGDLIGTVISFILFAYVLMVLGAFVVHFIITIQRFWKNLLGDEGYLMFTLPVSADAILWSKAISALIWTVATLLVVALSVFILVGHPMVFRIIDNVILQNLSNASWQRIDVLWTRAFPPLFWVLMLLAAVASGLHTVFDLYAAMAIGHTAKSHKILASVGSYMAIAMAEGVASGFLSTVLTPVLSRPLSELPVWDYMFLTVEDMALFADALGQTLCGFITMVLLVTAVLGTAVYLVTRHILKNRLNLE